jgi:HK97 gp10 family phage protein
MGNNPSVKQLKTDFQDFAKNVATDFHTATLLMADEIVENIKANAPLGDTGHLRASIVKKDVSTLDSVSGKVSVLILGGGSLTTRRTSTGHSYDYAVATEFGTSKETAEPFFYSTYRAYVAGGLEFFKETLAETIARNNEVRALHSSDVNYTTVANGTTTRSVGSRGAVVIQKR